MYQVLCKTYYINSISKSIVTKVIVCKSSGEQSLIMQCTACTFGPAQSCNFRKFKALKKNMYVCSLYQPKSIAIYSENTLESGAYKLFQTVEKKSTAGDS